MTSPAAARDTATALSALPWDRFHDWFHSVCVVVFDLELGQELECIYPSHARLSDQERSNVCYLAFPDSNSGCMGDTQFHFRFPRTPGAHSLTKAQQRYNVSCPHALSVDAAHLYGFAFFRQVKDRSIRRGYFQKSVILLSRLPFVELFGCVVALLAPLYFDTDRQLHAQLLDRFCRDVDHWPPPLSDQPLLLPVLQHVFESCIPSRLDGSCSCLSWSSSVSTTASSATTTASITTTASSATATAAAAAPSPVSCATAVAPDRTVVPAVCQPHLYSALRPALRHVQLLWELVLTCQPLIVMADSPAVASHVVHALASFVWPLRYGGDYRPFFTIHDSDFLKLTQQTDSRPPPAVLLGVTNPFFAKTLHQWPHILRVDDAAILSGENVKYAKNKSRKLKSARVLETKPGLYTQYKPFLQKDRQMERLLLRGELTDRPAQVQNALLRRRLHELTQSFVLPLERYIATLMPLQRSISPYKAAPVMRSFNMDEFCLRLDDYGPHLTSGVRGDWVGLYRRFFQCANFADWFQARQRDISRRLQALHLDALADADVVAWMRGKHEVELVDLALRLRRKLSEAAADPRLPVRANTLAKLRVHLHDITTSLPTHLQPSLRPPPTPC